MTIVRSNTPSPIRIYLGTRGVINARVYSVSPSDFFDQTFRRCVSFVLRYTYMLMATFTECDPIPIAKPPTSFPVYAWESVFWI